MKQSHTFRLQQRFDRGEKLVVVVDPHMLEHTDRDDPVVLSLFLAVIAKMKSDPVCKSRRRRTALGNLMLLFRQGQPGDLDAAFSGDKQCQTTPATADVEHLLSRAQQ